MGGAAHARNNHSLQDNKQGAARKYTPVCADQQTQAPAACLHTLCIEPTPVSVPHTPCVRLGLEHGQAQHLIYDLAVAVYCCAIVDALALWLPLEPELALQCVRVWVCGVQVRPGVLVKCVSARNTPCESAGQVKPAPSTSAACWKGGSACCCPPAARTPASQSPQRCCLRPG